MTRSRHHSFDALRRLFAAALAALVVALGLMSVSPVLHAWVHHQPCDVSGDHAHHHSDSLPADAEHNCVIAWFAHGVSLALDSAVLDAPSRHWQHLAAPDVEEVRLVSRRFVRPPGRGPPVSLV